MLKFRDGKIVGNLRAYDARLTVTSSIQSMHLPVLEYLKVWYLYFIFQDTGCAPAVCSKNTSLFELMRLIVEMQVHHAWIVDNGIENVVSVTDICKFLAHSL